MRKLLILVGVLFLAGCTTHPLPAPVTVTPPTSTPTTTPTSTPTTSPTPTPTPSPTVTRDPLDFSNLPENQRPVLSCIPVTYKEGEVIARDWQLNSGSVPTGWRVEMGVGNNQNETWSLLEWGTDFWLTNFWSVDKPSGTKAMYVNDERFTFDGWADRVMWPKDRLDTGRAVSQWMLEKCG